MLYDIEDPWGRFDFDPGSRPWNDKLAQILGQARPDRLVVATSRLDVARAAGALDSVKQFLVPLEAEHYGKRERIKLYATRVPALPRELQLLAVESQQTVLDELATPLEIQKFFDALPTIDRKRLQNPDAFVADAIRKAHQDSIEVTVREQIEHRDDVRAAAVVWALLKATDKLTGRLVRTLEDALADRDSAMTRGLSPFIEFFVAARNFRQTDDVVSYYHPRVEAGIEQALDRNATLVRQTLRRLIDILVSPDGPDETWGAGAAARLLAAFVRKEALRPAIAPMMASRIDAWLAERVAIVEPRELERFLDIAAAAGSSKSAVGEIARYINHRPDKSFGGLMRWGEPKRDAAWRDWIRKDPTTKVVFDRYIRHVLPEARVSFPTSAVAKFENLAPGLTPAFLAAADAAVGYGVLSTDDIIAAGALRDRAGFEKVVDDAVAALTLSAAEAEAKANEKQLLDMINGVYSEDYAEHLADNDEGYTAQVFLKAYVQETRRTMGWRHLAQHRHADRLRSDWFSALLRDVDKGAVDQDELNGAFAAGYGTDDEVLLWYVTSRHWREGDLEPLRARLTAANVDPSVRKAAVICLIEHAPAEFETLVNTLRSAGRRDRLVEIALDLAELQRRRTLDAEHHDEAAQRSLPHLPIPYAELSDAAFALAANETPTLEGAAVEALAAITARSVEICLFRLQVASTHPFNVESDILWLLAHSEDADAAAEAARAASVRAMTDILNGGLTHRFASVKAVALEYFTRTVGAPLPQQLLDMADDPGSPVLKALAAALDAIPHPDHAPTLLKLARNTWSAGSRYHGEDDDFPIAKAAVAAISKALPLPDSTISSLYDLALETSDLDLLRDCFDLLARHGGAKLQSRLLEQAITRGRAQVRKAAGYALLRASDTLAPSVVRKITPELLLSRAEIVAAMLAIILTWRAGENVVLLAANALAASPERRVLLLLMICAAKDREKGMTSTIAALLPKDHPAVSWCLIETGALPTDTVVADLGSARACAAALRFLTVK